MSSNRIEIDKVLQEAGYKLTVQRQVVFEVIIKNRDKHLTAEQIFEEVRMEHPHIGLATVYRSLQLFENIGIINHLNLDDGYFRYQLADPKVKEHHHLVCNTCGKVIDIKEDMLRFFAGRILSEKGFKVTNCRVQFFGICEGCQKQ